MMKSPVADAVLLRQSDYRRTRWKNDAGWTSEIALENAADGHFDWRISVAEIDGDSDFSVYPGIDRTIVVLSGKGMVLDIAGHGSHELRPLENPLVFLGEEKIHARLSSGPTRDFNVMTRRTSYVHQLTICRPGMTQQVSRTKQAAVFLYVVEGTLWGAAPGDSWYVPKGSAEQIDVPAEPTLFVVELRKL